MFHTCYRQGVSPAPFLDPHPDPAQVLDACDGIPNRVDWLLQRGVYHSKRFLLETLEDMEEE